MMKRLILILCAIVLSAGLYAQSTEEDGQVLIFRHSGDIDLFYISELDSIVLSCYDADSICHDEIVSQVFHAKDTIMLVPIAEIDSVAFGNRNEMVLNSSVHELFDDVDFPWIIRTEGNNIFYRKDTPNNILPKVGEKLYYASANDFIPLGLAAKVVSVVALGDETAVTLEQAELNEIFDELFYAGRIVMGKTDGEAMKVYANKTPEEQLHESVPLNDNFDLGSLGTLRFNGSTDLTGYFVVEVRPLRPTYCHAVVRGETNIGFEWELQSKDSGSFEISSRQLRIPLPPIAWGALHPVIYTNLFFEAEAELSFKYSMSRNYAFEFEWIRRDGKDEVRNGNPTGNDQQAQDEARIEVLLNGEIYAGAELGVELNLTGDRAGVIFGLKAGPYITGELGFGMLRDLRNYDTSITYNDNLDMGVKLKFDISAFNHDTFLFWGDREEHTLYEHELTLCRRSIHLFPEYKKTRVIGETAKANKEISVATKVENEIPYELETGFEIINMDGEVLDSIFVEKPVMAKEAEEQVFSNVFELPIGADESQLRVRPIFHYAGYTVSAESVGVLHDSNIMPFTSYTTNGVGTFISGAYAIGTAKDENTVYHVGNYLPVPIVIYESLKKQANIIQGQYLSDEYEIIGTWTGESNGESISIAFNDYEECSGTYIVGNESRSFTYSINNPQSGDIRLLFDDETTIVITIMSINSATLKYRNKNDKQDYELYRQ